MQTRPLGQTQVQIPEIGLGTWNYESGVAPLKAGLTAGACFIDTAESYSSEATVGQAVRAFGAPVFVATKVSPSNFRRDAIRRAAEGSLQRLGIDVIDLYQLHKPNPEIPMEETLGAMEDLVDAGKVRWIGVSNFTRSQLMEARRAARRHPIVSNQVRFNLVDRTILPDLLPYCQTEGITVIAYSPLSRQFQHIRDADPEGCLSSIARECGKTEAQVALNWCLCHPSVVVIPKSSSVSHTVENCGGGGWQLSPEQFARLERGIRFRRRGRVDALLRGLMTPRTKKAVQSVARFLPASVRRRFQ